MMMTINETRISYDMCSKRTITSKLELVELTIMDCGYKQIIFTVVVNHYFTPSMPLFLSFLF
jgi:hypothetical protein